MLTAKDFRRIALGMKDAVESAHMGHPDFRVNGRIFATLHPTHRSGIIKLTPDQQQIFGERRPPVCDHGLKQAWQLTRQWTVDAGADRSALVRETGYYQFNVNVPPASGGAEDFPALYLGAGSREETWSWTPPVEQRRAASEDKRSFFMGANGEVRSGLAMAAGIQTFRSVAWGGGEKFSGDARLGAAYRPPLTRLVVLDRFDYLRLEQQGTDLPFDNWRLINNLVMNYKIDGTAILCVTSKDECVLHLPRCPY